MGKLLLLLMTLLLVACGGSPATGPTAALEPAATTAPPTQPPTQAPALNDNEAGSEPATAVAPPTAAPEPEEDSGIDAATGLLLNPDQIFTGVEFVVKGTIVSMNLTPQERPEFLIQAPSGKRYRIRSQPLSETFTEDGRQLRAFEYRQGMIARATVILPLGSSSTDTLVTQDLTILLSE